MKIKRNKAHRQWKLSLLEADLNTSKYLWAKLNALISKTKRIYYRDKFNQSIGESRLVYIDIPKENKFPKNYKGCIASNGFVINEALPTRVVDKSSTCLDHFIFQHIKQPEFFVLDNNNFTDHYPIHLKWYYGSVNHKLTKE